MGDSFIELSQLIVNISQTKVSQLWLFINGYTFIEVLEAFVIILLQPVQIGQPIVATFIHWAHLNALRIILRCLVISL